MDVNPCDGLGLVIGGDFVVNNRRKRNDVRAVDGVLAVVLIEFVKVGLAKTSLVEKSVSSVGDEVDFFGRKLLGDVGAKKISRSFEGENSESNVLFIGEVNGPGLE